MEQHHELWQQGLDFIAQIEAEKDRQPAISYPVCESPYPTLTLDQILADLGHVPQGTAVLGICDDGLPVLFDLNNSKTGSILIVGDPGSGKSHLLETFISSVCQTNSPRQMCFSIIGMGLGQKDQFHGIAQFSRSTNPEASEAGEILREYCQIAEQRRTGRENGPVLLLFIEEIDRLVARLDDDSYQALLWLVKHGAASRVWVIASLGTSAWGKFPTHLLDAFGTWLIGHIEPYQTGTNLAQLPVENACYLIPNAQFSLSYRGEWVPFWVPALQR